MVDKKPAEKEPSEQRILALDIGSKRIGLAVWRPEARLASLLPTRHRKTLKKDLSFFEEVLKTERIEAFLIGLPFSLSGKLTSSTENALFWKDQLEKSFALPVYTQDESFSTQEANQIMKTTQTKQRDEKRDGIAAAVLLEEFIRAKN